ncbi:hypothetical protein Tco_0036343, partial [Tanacetum coccineum]
LAVVLGARDAARNLEPFIGGGGEQEEISGNGVNGNGVNGNGGNGNGGNGNGGNGNGGNGNGGVVRILKKWTKSRQKTDKAKHGKERVHKSRKFSSKWSTKSNLGHQSQQKSTKVNT